MRFTEGRAALPGMRLSAPRSGHVRVAAEYVPKLEPLAGCAAPLASSFRRRNNASDCQRGSRRGRLPPGSAVRAEPQPPGSGGLVVMQDPAGHPFCICARLNNAS